MLGMRLSILGLTERGLFLDYIHSCLIYTRENITHHVLGQIAMAYIPVAPMLGYASLFCWESRSLNYVVDAVWLAMAQVRAMRCLQQLGGHGLQSSFWVRAFSHMMQSTCSSVPNDQQVLVRGRNTL